MKAIVIAIIIVSIMLSGCMNKQLEQVSKVNFPSHIFLEKKSPDGKTNAVIYSWSNADKEDLLGSESRFLLGFITTKSKWYIDYELSEDNGNYEGGITGIEWLNNEEVLIKRRISDSSQDIKYNIRSNEWKLIEGKE